MKDIAEAVPATLDDNDRWSSKNLTCSLIGGSNLLIIVSVSFCIIWPSISFSSKQKQYKTTEANYRQYELAKTLHTMSAMFTSYLNDRNKS